MLAEGLPRPVVPSLQLLLRLLSSQLAFLARLEKPRPFSRIELGLSRATCQRLSSSLALLAVQIAPPAHNGAQPRQPRPPGRAVAGAQLRLGGRLHQARHGRRGMLRAQPVRSRGQSSH